ncbi:MAG: CRISPR-associated endoribonuclease Cas6 [Saprospirales bacterium]|nr:MAG: CRISPR-associated endoribonuclease Cas6 [Saprospirales bacterium]
MRFILTLENNTPQRVPINYQYPLSAWIYKTFAAADGEFANWLHEHGYAFNGNRKFKLFTFSNLMLRGSQFENKPLPSLVVPPGKHQLLLSFFIDDTAQHFIRGLFNSRELIIADRVQRAQFLVSSVESLAIPRFTGTAKFRLLSPLVLSEGKMDDGKLRAQYLSPEDAQYSDALRANLLRKYLAAHQHRVVTIENSEDVQYHFADLPFDPNNWELKLLSEPRSKLQTVKAGTSEQSKVRGFVYKFQLSAPPELMAFGYQAGYGEKCSLGFGCAGI